MADRSVVVRLKGEVAGYKAAMADAAKATKGVGDAARQTSATATAASKGWSGLGEAIARDLGGGSAKARLSFGDLSTAIRENRQEWDDLASKSLVAGTVIAGGMGLATKAAIDWESAWAGVVKTVDGSDAEMAELEQGLRGLTKTLPATHQEIAGVAEAAGQLGIARGDIVKFTETAIALGESTNLSAEEAATGLAQIANVMGTVQREGVAGYEKLGSTLVALGNAGASTESQILETAQRLTGAAKLIGASEADILALGNAMSSVGIESELGGGAMSRAMLKMHSAVRAGGDDLETFAEIAGMSATQFAQAWQNDPISAVQAFVVGLEKVNTSGGDVSSILSDVGLAGTQNAQVLLRLAGASDVLTDSLEMGRKEWQDYGALQEEAGKRYATTASRLQIAQNSFRDAAIDLGSVAGPALASVAEFAAGAADAFVRLPEPVKATTAALGGTAAAALLLVGGGVKAVGAYQDLRATLEATGLTAGQTSKAMRGLGGAVALVGTAAIAAELDEMIVTSRVAEVESKSLAEGLEALAGGSRDAAAGLNDLYRHQGGWGGLGREEVISTTEAIDRFQISAESALGDSLHMKLARLSGNGALAKFEKEATQIDLALAGMVRSGNADAAAESLRRMTDGMDPETAKRAVAMLTEYNSAADATKPVVDQASGAILGMTGELDENADGMVDASESAAGLADSLKDVQDALTMLGGGFRAEQAAMRSVQESLTGIKDAAKDGAGWNELSAAMEKAADDALAYAGAQVEMGRGSETIAAGIQRVRDQVIESGVSAGKSRAFMEDYADAIGLIPEEARTLVEAAGVTESTAEVLALDASIVGLDGKVVTVKEEGANPSKGRVMELDGAIFGLDGKTVKVQEIGATPSGERVVRFQGKIYALRGKTVNVAATTSGEGALRNLQGIINRMTGRTVNVHTQYTHSGTPVAMGVRRAQADGGILSGGHHGLVQAFADGGYVGSFATAHPQIRPAGGAGVLWAEEGAGPWEAFISGHPAKAERSRSIWLETGRRLGMIQAYADGGVASRHYVSAQPAPRVTVSAPASPAPSWDYDALAGALVRSFAEMPTPAVSQRQLMEALGGLLVKGRKAGWSSTEGF